MTTIDFCIPIKNEEKVIHSNILKLLEFLKNNHYDFSWKIIMIVNGSNDNSKLICENLEKNNKDFLKLKHLEKGGKGLSIKTYANESIADMIIFMDVDLSTSLDDLQTLLDSLIIEKYDICIGSRFLKKSKVERSFNRKLFSIIYNKFSRIFLSHNFLDLQCGFKGFNRNVAKKIFPIVIDEKWFFDTEFIILSKYYGFKIKEIPVDWKENRFYKRQTKLSILKNGFIFFYKTILLKIRIYKY